jgi:hypothetical protein
MIELNVRPGPAISRDEFVATHPRFSIALDGYVRGEPFLVADGPYRNFNHHEVVDRSCTSATCEQARRAVLLGLYDLFRDANGRRAQLHVNDCDQDVCLSTWILMNPDRAAEPLVRVLSQIEDLLDASAGTFPMPHETDMLAQVRWVFEPYAHARPRVAGLSSAEMRSIIDDVHHRIAEFVVGRSGKLPLSGSHKRIGGGLGWVLVEVAGGQARERLIADGVRAAVELFGRNGDHWLYSIWRRSEYIVGFPVRALLDALNAAEELDPNVGWGGADNVGGAPRGRGSKLPPDEVERVINRVLRAESDQPPR